MKKVFLKIICVVILFCLVFSFVSCEKVKDFDGEFVRTGFYSDLNENSNQRNHLFKSRFELDEFVDEISASFDYNDGVEWLHGLFVKYDDAYFQTNNLILVGMIEGSGSIRHEIESVVVFENSVVVTVNRLVPEIGTCDMAYWHLFLSVSKVQFDGNNVIANFNIVNI